MLGTLARGAQCMFLVPASAS